MAVTASQYRLKVQAMLDNKSLEDELKKTQAEIKAKKLDLVDMKLTMKDGDLTKFTTKVKDSTGKITKETKKIGATYDEAGKRSGAAIQSITTETEKGAKATNYFADSMVSAAKSALKYSLGLGLINKAMQELGKGIQYIKDLDVEMRNIQIVAGYTDEEIQNLAVSYNDLAKQMGATTLEVASGSLEWTRQGKTIVETQELLRSTLMLSKLGNVESAQATEYLTSILNGFKLEAKDTETVVSKLVAVDNAAATSVQELATAMQKSSVSAQAAGVDFDTLVAYIGTVSSITRLSAQTVGTSFKTMFARFQDIKDGALEGEGAINNVEKALGRVTLASGEQMSIMNRQTGEFKDFSIVVEQLAGEWGNLTEMEQANIVKAFAGVRQRESFLALMENQEMMHNLLGEAMDSEGLAADRYATYLDGLEAAQNKATAAWEGMVQASIDGDLVKLFYDASAALFEFIEGLGGVDALLAGVAAGLVTYGAGMLTAEIATGGLTIAWQALTAAIASNPLGILAVAVAAVTVEAIKLNEQIEKSEEAVANNWKVAMEKAGAAADDTSDILDEFREKVDQVNQTYEDANWAAKPFIDSQKMLLDGLEAVLPVLKENSSGWRDYKKSAEEAAKAIGYSIDKFGKLYKERSDGYKMYAEGLEILTYTEWTASAAAEQLAEQMGRVNKETSVGSEEVAALTENFQKFIDATYNSSGGENEGLTLLLQNISDINRLYQDGILDMDAYFEQLTTNLEGVDFSTMFGEDEESAEIFFAGLAENATHALDTINAEFEAGNISMTQYSEQLALWGEHLIEIDEIARDLGFGDVLTGALGQVSEGVTAVTQALELNAAVEDSLYEMQQGNLEFTSEAYAKRSQMLGALAAESGMVIKDMEGNVINGSQNISNYLMQTEGNLARFADQTANQTGMNINKIIRGAGNMLQKFAESIGSFSASIDFIPHADNNISLQGIFGDLMSGGGLSLPAFGYTVEANAGGSFEGLQAAIADFGSSMSSSDYGLDWTANIYADTKVAQDAYNDFGNSVGSLTNYMKELGAASGKTKEQIAKDAKSIDGLLDLVIAKIKQEQNARKDALKERLSNYKKIIDKRKDLLRSMAAEEEFQRNLEEKQKDYANLQAELEELRLDDSEEAAARRRILEEQLADLKLEMDEARRKRELELQEKALDKDYKKFEKFINKKIAKIEKYLSQPGRIVADALKLIKKGGDDLYKDLIKWNAKYGSGIKQDVVDVWKDAQAAIKKYGLDLEKLLAKMKKAKRDRNKKKKKDGGKKGFASGSGSLDSGSRNPFQDMGTPDFDPQLASFSGAPEGTNITSGGIEIESLMTLNVSGNLDSSVLPDIEKLANRVMKQLSKASRLRGDVRTAGQFST